MTADTPVRIAYRQGPSQVVHFCIPEYALSFARMIEAKREVKSVQVGSEPIERVS
jgi:hypothetical protein